MLLNVTGSKLALLAFFQKLRLLDLFAGVRNKLHAPLRDPVADSLQVIIQFTL